MRWSVYKVIGRRSVKVLKALGYVNAASQPAALFAAWKRWSREVDSDQVQNGFSVRPYARDHLPLGRLGRSATKERAS